ncbi:MAG: T9SS type A sorting domain-containing protein [Flavobacteriales bacterium]|nr:T9SS type A sorting domain-containing protein [Flavobacteriales bacterium]
MALTLPPTGGLLSAFAIVLSASTAMSQNGWLHATSTWTETYAYFDGSYLHHSVFVIQLDGDTMIGGQDYQRLRRTGTDTLWAIGGTDPFAIVPIDQYLGALREDTVQQQWWVVFSGFLNEELLYDFGLIEGQVLSGTFGDCAENYVVGPVDSVQVGSTWHRRFHFSPWDRYIIEGIGMSSGLFGHLCLFIEEYGCLLTYAIHDDELVVDGCGSLALSVAEPGSDRPAEPFPNPVIDACVLGSAAAGQLVSVLDAAGRVVAMHRAGGHGELDLAALPSGTYLLRLTNRCHRVLKL